MSTRLGTPTFEELRQKAAMTTLEIQIAAGVHIQQLAADLNEDEHLRRRRAEHDARVVGDIATPALQSLN